MVRPSSKPCYAEGRTSYCQDVSKETLLPNDPPLFSCPLQGIRLNEWMELNSLQAFLWPGCGPDVSLGPKYAPDGLTLPLTPHKSQGKGSLC